MTLPNPSRTIAIGDIHGCAAALRAVLSAIRPAPDDLIVTLGDYVDRGPDSRGVLDRLIELRGECQLVSILGNHDDMLIQALDGVHAATFLTIGGTATLASYGGSGPEHLHLIPNEHVIFLKACRPYYEIEGYIFVHGCYVANLPMSDQPELALRWESLRDDIPGPHFSGKMVIAGHTSQRSGEILDVGHIKCIDTCCYGGGWLTAMEVRTGQIWQADRDGRIRDKPPV
jgi:serine/threonine protein phosphatase 1